VRFPSTLAFNTVEIPGGVRGYAVHMAAHTWDLRNPDGGMLGLEFARGVADATDYLLAHALPERITVVVTDDNDTVIAKGEDLAHDASRPMARLWVRGGRVERENVWPDESDLGRPVILPGGEVGILRAWWNADDGRSWRWQVQFSNQV
jgi:hypothetical protein